MLTRPTFRSLTESFEGWAYRNGFRKALAELEHRKLIESQQYSRARPRLAETVRRLTEKGRLHALGGRDPEACWSRQWDGQWRLVVYDLPAAQGTERNRLRNVLRQHGFGWLQNSVWVSPLPLHDQGLLLANARVDVRSLSIWNGRPAAGETDEQIVTGAWDWAELNRRYRHHLNVLEMRPRGILGDVNTADVFRNWARDERQAWLAAVSMDPLLPEKLLPPGYLGQIAWRARVAALSQAAVQLRSFAP